MRLQSSQLRFYWVILYATMSMWSNSRHSVALAWATARRQQQQHYRHHRLQTFSSLATTITTGNIERYNKYRPLLDGNNCKISPHHIHGGGIISSYSSTPGSSNESTTTSNVNFKRGDKVQVEVVNFGPLGASVEVIGLGHGSNVPLLPADTPEPYGIGLIIQNEIKYFRESRDFVDVVRGEVLPGYVQNVREEDGKLDISLRTYGGKAKSIELGSAIVECLEGMPDGRLNIGEKSTPQEISEVFPGVSKSVFKKALGGLYKKGVVQPGPKSIELMTKP